MTFILICVVLSALLYALVSPGKIPTEWFMVISISGASMYVAYAWILNRFVVFAQRTESDSWWGLHGFYGTNSETPGISIVFVHGLASHPKYTWLAKTSGASTDRDWIKSSLLPNLSAELKKTTGVPLRAYYFNYESRWMASASQGRLRKYGERLQFELRKIIGNKEERVIIISHSLGGLVVKEALTVSRSREELPLSERIAGLIFLGTPHYGSNFASLGLLIALACSPFDPNLGLIIGIRRRSQALGDLHENFIRHYGGIPIVNFYESEPVRLKFGFIPITSAYVVPEESATFVHQETENISMYGGHSDLNKLDEGGDNFRQLSRELLRILSTRLNQNVSQTSKTLPGKINHDPDHSRRNTDSTKSFWRLFNMSTETYYIEKCLEDKGKARHPDTCHWILNQTSELQWLRDQNESALLWISGIIGSGKTTLCTFICEQLLQLHSQKEVLILSTLCAPDFLRSERQIVRDLIHRSLMSLPDLKGAAFSSLERAVQSDPLFSKWFDQICSQKDPSEGPTSQDSDPEFSFDTTWQWKILQMLLAEAQVCDIFIIVDGLDCLAAATLKGLMSGFREYLMADSRFRVKLILTTRPSELIRADVIRFKYSQRLETEATDLVANDIEIYLRSELNLISALRSWPEGMNSRVLNHLQRASGDMFLYASFAVKWLASCETSDVQGVLQKPPNDDLDNLYSLYRQALHSMNSVIRSRRSNILLCLLYARRKLTLKDLQGVFGSGISHENVEARNAIIGDLKLYSPLVRFHESSDYVDFVHPSARDYIDDLANRADLSYSHFLSTRQKGNAVLARDCLSYMISTRNVNFPMYWNDFRARDEIRVFNKYPGLQYALSFWLSHCQAALCIDDSDSETSAVLRGLKDLDTHRRNGGGNVSFWFEVMKCRPLKHNRMQPEDEVKTLRLLTSTEFFALCGLPSVVEKNLQKETSIQSNAAVIRNHNTGLALAIKAGCATTLNVLLTHHTIKSFDGPVIKNVISKAAWSGSLEVLKKVIQLKTDEKFRLCEIAEAIIAGVATKKIAVVNAILDQDIDIDLLTAKDITTHLTILHWIFASRQLEDLSPNQFEYPIGTASLLVKRGAAINARDNLGNTILHYISYNPCLAQKFLIKRLIDEGADPLIPNMFGWLPIHLLARRCRSIHSLLYLDKYYPLSIFQRTRGDMTVLHWATQRAASGTWLDEATGDVLFYLLKRGLSLDTSDRRGTTPLQLFQENGRLAEALWMTCSINTFVGHGQPTLRLEQDPINFTRDTVDGFTLIKSREDDITEELDHHSSAHVASQKRLLWPHAQFSTTEPAPNAGFAEFGLPFGGDEMSFTQNRIYEMEDPVVHAQRSVSSAG